MYLNKMSFKDLINAICDNNENAIIGLINKDYINNTYNGFTPLLISIYKQYINITKLLLNADGIDINKCDEKNGSS